MKTNELPEKYQTCDWLWNYGFIGLTEEYIKRLNNAISILESLNEHTDAKYLKEIKDKLLEDTPEPKIVKLNTDAFIEKACGWIKDNGSHYIDIVNGQLILKKGIVKDIKNYMKGE